MTEVHDEATMEAAATPPSYNTHNDGGDAVAADADEGTGSRIRVAMRSLTARVHHVVMLLTYPFMVLFTLVSLLMVITFCIFPTLICITFGVCIYYCLMEEPIPLSVLLRYMLSPEAEEAGYPNLYPVSQQRPVIQSKLIIRKVLRIDGSTGTTETDDNNNDAASTKKEYSRKHPFPIQISTDHKRLHFSEPLVLDEKEPEKGQEGSASEQVGIPPCPRTSASTGDEGTTEEGETTRTSNNTEVPTASPDENDEDCGLVEIAIGRMGDDKDNATSLGKESSKDDGESCIALEANQQTTNETEADAVQAEEEEDYFGIGDVRDRGTTCDICLIDYKVGDDVAWSPNLECTHAFHKECVLDWLVRKPTCPNCRHDYLKGKKDDDG
jgi:hypothetical protein